MCPRPEVRGAGAAESRRGKDEYGPADRARRQGAGLWAGFPAASAEKECYSESLVPGPTCTSNLVLPGTGTGAESKRKIHVSISFTSASTEACMFRLSGIGVVRRAQIQSLVRQTVITLDKSVDSRDNRVFSSNLTVARVERSVTCG